MEELRDEKLASIMVGLQSSIRWHLAKKDAHLRNEQRAGLLVLQRNIRSWLNLRTWPWFKLYGKVRPLLKAGKEAEEMEKLLEKIKELEANLAKEEKTRKEMEEQNSKLVTEKTTLFSQLQSEKDVSSEGEQKTQKLASQKNDLEKQVHEMTERLQDQEDKNNELSKLKKKNGNGR